MLRLFARRLSSEAGGRVGVFPASLPSAFPSALERTFEVVRGASEEPVDYVVVVHDGDPASLVAARTEVSLAFPGPVPHVFEVQGSDPEAVAASLTSALDNPEPTANSASLPRMAVQELSINDYKPTHIMADGLVFMTPLASQLYAKRSRGAALDLRVSCVQVSALCSTSLSFRPLVLPSSSLFVVSLSGLQFNRRVTLQVDSKEVQVFAHDGIVVTEAPHMYNFTEIVAE